MAYCGITLWNDRVYPRGDASRVRLSGLERQWQDMENAGFDPVYILQTVNWFGTGYYDSKPLATTRHLYGV